MTRVFLVLMGLCFVSAAALAQWGPDGLTLADAISVVNVMAVFRAQEYALRHWPHYWWDDWAMAWLMRPAWLVPAILGIVCGGMSAGLAPAWAGRRR